MTQRPMSCNKAHRDNFMTLSNTQYRLFPLKRTVGLLTLCWHYRTACDNAIGYCSLHMVRHKNKPFLKFLLYRLRQGGFVLPGVCPFVCLSVCLSVSNCTWKLLIGYSWKFYHRFICGQGRNDWILEVIRLRIRIYEFLNYTIIQSFYSPISAITHVNKWKTKGIYFNIVR